MAVATLINQTTSHENFNHLPRRRSLYEMNSAEDYAPAKQIVRNSQVTQVAFSQSSSTEQIPAPMDIVISSRTEKKVNFG